MDGGKGVGMDMLSLNTLLYELVQVPGNIGIRRYRKYMHPSELWSAGLAGYTF